MLKIIYALYSLFSVYYHYYIWMNSEESSYIGLAYEKTKIKQENEEQKEVKVEAFDIENLMIEDEHSRHYFFDSSENPENEMEVWMMPSVSLNSFGSCFDVGSHFPEFQKSETPEIKYQNNEPAPQKIRKPKTTYKGLKYIVRKIFELYEQHRSLPPFEEILNYIYSDMKEHKQIKHPEHKDQFCNLKRRVYDCRNVIIALSKIIKINVIDIELKEENNPTKDIEGKRKKMQMLQKLKQQYTQMRRIVARNKRHQSYQNKGDQEQILTRISFHMSEESNTPIKEQFED